MTWYMILCLDCCCTVRQTRQTNKTYHIINLNGQWCMQMDVYDRHSNVYFLYNTIFKQPSCWYIYIYIYVCVCVCVCVHGHECLHACNSECVCVCVCVCMMYVHVHMHLLHLIKITPTMLKKSRGLVHLHEHGCMYVCMCACMPSWTNICLPFVWLSQNHSDHTKEIRFSVQLYAHEYEYVCLCVCMLACIYIHMYACTHACMYTCMHVFFVVVETTPITTAKIRCLFHMHALCMYK